MKALSPQAVFDAALFGVRKQGYKRSVNALNQCSYRGEGGVSCGIGHALPDRLAVLADHCGYDTGVLTVMEAVPQIGDLLSRCDAMMLVALQRAHDDICDGLRADGYFNNRMSLIADEYGLKYTEASS